MLKKIIILITTIVVTLTTLGVNNSHGLEKGKGYSQHDVTVKSGLSVKEIKAICPKNMKELAPYLHKVENSKKPINAIFLMSVIREESGNGTSYKYKHMNNVAGIKRGGRYASFSSKKESIYYMQDFLNRLYINQGRKSVWRIGPKYCDANWARNINNIAYGQLRKAWSL